MAFTKSPRLLMGEARSLEISMAVAGRTGISRELSRSLFMISERKSRSWGGSSCKSEVEGVVTRLCRKQHASGESGAGSLGSGGSASGREGTTGVGR